MKDEECNLEFLDKTTSYFVDVEILNIRKKLPFPVISSVVKKQRKVDGKTTIQQVRIFDNDFRGLVTIDKTTLEDLINFHELKPEDYKIKRGYYFDEGFNTRIKSVIQQLFDERKK